MDAPATGMGAAADTSVPDLPWPVGTTLEAFLAAVERSAWRFAEMALRDREAALDAVQDAMLRLAERYATRPPMEWPPLFWSILRRRITDLQRRRTVRQRVLVWLGHRAPGAEDADPPAWEVPDDREPDPARVLVARAGYAAMSRAVRALPHRQQQAFMLRVFAGLSVADAAQAMGCSQGSVKTHLSRALATLRIKLEEWR